MFNKKIMQQDRIQNPDATVISLEAGGPERVQPLRLG